MSRDDEVVAVRDPASHQVVSGSAEMPTVANVNINKSSGVQIGPKFVTVTQNVSNAVMVRELSLPKYLWDIVKNSSRAERVACAAALVVVIVCVTLIVYFTVQTTKAVADSADAAPHEWMISRDMWLAQSYTDRSNTSRYDPLLLVVVQHSVTSECPRFVQCAQEIKRLQTYFIETPSLSRDIPYNFLVGNDGRVYEGRGWGVIGAHTMYYNSCSLGIGFIGDYREDMTPHSRVTEAQLNHTRMLLEEGVRRGFLRADYQVVGAKDLQDTASPGSNLYRALLTWPNYDHLKRFKGLSCDQIKEKYGNVSLAVV